MRKIPLLLILFSFFVLTPSLFAQDHDWKLKLDDPTKDRDAQPGSRDNFDSWEADKRIKQNFIPLRTIPLYEDDKVDVEIGPAQFQIRLAI